MADRSEGPYGVSDLPLCIGGVPESEVAAWWDHLSPERRVALGPVVRGRRGALLYEWDVPWSWLSPVGQQVFVHEHYARVIRNRTRGGWNS